MVVFLRGGHPSLYDADADADYVAEADEDADDDADDDDADADADDDDDSLFMKRYCLVLSLMHTGCILLKGQLSHS